MTSIVRYKDVREAALAFKEEERAMLMEDLRTASMETKRNLSATLNWTAAIAK